MNDTYRISKNKVYNIIDGVLNVSDSGLTSLPELPDTICTLNINNNNIESLPILPSNLEYLDISKNNITILPELSEKLIYFFCDKNPIKSLIPARYVHIQHSNWLHEYYLPYIRSYEGQKYVLTNEPWMLNEMIKYVTILKTIKIEFAHVFSCSDLNLL